MIRHTSARCLLLILLWPATGSAQTGSIRGSVVDQTAFVLPGATVTLRGNGVPRTAYSDEQGTFELAGARVPRKSCWPATGKPPAWCAHYSAGATAERGAVRKYL